MKQGGTIIGEELFYTSDGATSSTDRTEVAERIMGGRKMSLVDTPGCMDTAKGQHIIKEIAEAVVRHPDGYDAFLMIFK